MGWRAKTEILAARAPHLYGLASDMLHDLRIRLTTPFLGATKGEPTLRFDRGDTGDWLRLNVAQWLHALSEAGKSLELPEDMDPTAVTVQPVYRRPSSMVLYRRNYHRDGKATHVMHEAINRNVILTVEVFLPGKLDSGDSHRPPTAEELRQMFEFIGTYVGLSPWGSKFGYGKFTVESLHPADSRTILANLQQRRNRLPQKFLEDNREHSSNIVIMGHRIADLSKSELLAVVAFYDSLLERQ